MWLGVVYFPTLNFRFPCQSVVAWVIGLSGALACALGVIEFRCAKNHGRSDQAQLGIFVEAVQARRAAFLKAFRTFVVSIGQFLQSIVQGAYSSKSGTHNERLIAHTLVTLA